MSTKGSVATTALSTSPVCISLDVLGIVALPNATCLASPSSTPSASSCRTATYASRPAEVGASASSGGPAEVEHYVLYHQHLASMRAESDEGSSCRTTTYASRPADVAASASSGGPAEVQHHVLSQQDLALNEGRERCKIQLPHRHTRQPTRGCRRFRQQGGASKCASF